jgi:hypothetical protein
MFEMSTPRALVECASVQMPKSEAFTPGRGEGGRERFCYFGPLDLSTSVTSSFG